MKRKIYRAEVGDTAVALSDMGFTVAAVAMMTGRNPVTIYHHLGTRKRIKKGIIVRKAPDLDGSRDAVVAAVRKVFSNPEWLVKKTTDGRGAPMASVTKRTYTRSAKKAA